jgi:hypothetical protein
MIAVVAVPVRSAEVLMIFCQSLSSATDRASPRLFGSNGLSITQEPLMSNRTNRRSKPQNDHLHESIAIYLKMQRAESEEKFQQLLAEHDRCTDAEGKPRLVHRALEAFRRGP